MKQIESEHYIFHYAGGTKAEQDIVKIVAHQEACMAYISRVLGITMPLKLHYFLCETPEEVGKLYQGEPCNGLAVYPDKIYAVYNDAIQCIGFHEDAHLISFLLYDPNPDSPAVEEGFAMYFDRKWWGISNLDWVGFFIKCGRYVSIDKLLDAECFYGLDCSISYPIVGAFTEWLISVGGWERYLCFYRKRDQQSALPDVYGKTPADLNQSFVDYVKLFEIDIELEQRMSILILS